MRNILNINEGMTVDQKIAALQDSKNLINQILDTYYGTDKEKEDLHRNVEHIKQTILDESLLPNIDVAVLASLNDCLLRSEGVLGAL